jgi:hypothetical protein
MKRLIVSMAAIAVCLSFLGCVQGPPAEKPAASSPRPGSTTTDTAGSPNIGSADNTAVLDALRHPVEAKLGQPVVFKTNHVTVSDGWAFVDGQTVKPDGGTIDYSQTPYKEAVSQGAFDDSFSALLRLENGAWKVVTFSIGSTDVPWVEWPKTYGAPAAILPPM